MKFLNFLLLLSLIGCAHGKVRSVTKPLDKSKITKETPLYVFPVSTENIRFDGDKASEASRIQAEKDIITKQYHRLIISDLIKQGYKALEGNKSKTQGIAIKGNVSRFDHGSAAARSMVGMGAGASKMFTDFKVVDLSNKKTLGEFEIFATSGGRGGFSAMGSFMDAHLEDGSKQVAEFISEE